jgi:hypothetical protein
MQQQRDGGRQQQHHLPPPTRTQKNRAAVNVFEEEIPHSIIMLKGYES